jgi:hypothetical protein
MKLRCRTLLLLGLIGWAGIGVTGRAAETSTLAPEPTDGFVATLGADDRKATGIDKLSKEEQSELDFLVTKELSLARAGNVRGFAGTFTSRRNPAERVAAGIQRLDEGEQAKLNDLVASRLARRPDSSSSVTRLKKEVVTRAKSPMELHGEVSFTYGWGSGGREFKGGSIYVNAFDPDTGLSIGVGYAQYSGDGWWGYGPGYYYGPGLAYGAGAPRYGLDYSPGFGREGVGPGDCFRQR